MVIVVTCPYKDENKNCLISNITGKKKCLNPTPCCYVYDDDLDQEVSTHVNN